MYCESLAYRTYCTYVMKNSMAAKISYDKSNRKWLYMYSTYRYNFFFPMRSVHKLDKNKSPNYVLTVTCMFYAQNVPHSQLAMVFY